MDKYQNLIQEIATHKLIIFDLDGTLVDLHVDWGGLKLAIQELCLKQKNIQLPTKPLQEVLNDLKRLNDFTFYRKVFQLIEIYELQEKNYVINKRLIEIFNHISDKTVVIYSMNTRKCVDNFVRKYLSHVPDMIIAKEDMIEPKPSGKDISLLLKKIGLTKEDALYIGNSKADQKSAELAGIQFILV